MEFSAYGKLVLHGITTVAWILGIAISFVAVAKRKQLKEVAGISVGFYMSSVFVTEILYTVGACMILVAMGVNVMQYLANLEFWKFYSIVSSIDMTTIKIVGFVGWVGFILNRTISFLTPGYLLIKGGKNLPKYFYYSALTEIILELFTTILIFLCLFLK